jgi:ferredoxin
MRALILAVLATGCTQVCHTQVSNEKTTQSTAFQTDIAACTGQNNCVQLCADVFQIQASDIATCQLEKQATSTITVRVIVNDPARCEAGADDIYLDWGDDDGYEDDSGCDDDSCSDGSTDDGDDGDDGDGGDGSTDDGGDGTTDDGGDGDAIPHLPATHAGAHYSLAPQRN